MGRRVTPLLHTPVVVPLVGTLLVLIYARYSTDEQNPRSIEAQVQLCKHFIESFGITNYEIVILSDEGISGEEISRPGINQVREGIAKKSWHLILAEESSRLFRNPGACEHLVGSAVDQGIRVICLNDLIDTAEECWIERLHEAQQHHAQSNRLTVYRIKRSQQERWQFGAAMGPLRSGYDRVPTYPATRRDPEKGPFFDEVNLEWLPVIYEAYLRVAAKDPLWSVAQFLNDMGLPKINGSTDGRWTAREVISLIHCTLYRGLDQFRNTVSQKRHETGKHKQRRATRDEVWERKMPHLRMIPDWLWFRANDVIAERTARDDIPQGVEHPLFGIPRDSRGPLSGVFYCHVCGEKMIQDGRNEGGYRCRLAKGECWNKATALREDVHSNLKAEICKKLLSLDAEFDILADRFRVKFELELREQVTIIEGLTVKERSLDEMCESIVSSIERIQKTHESPQRLEKRLLKREAELLRVRAELDRRRSLADPFNLPTAETLRASRDAMVQELQVLDRHSNPLLRRLLGKIHAVPHQQFGCNKVVLRARFKLRCDAILSDELRLQLLNDSNEDTSCLLNIPVQVDLFRPSIGPEYGLKAIAHRDSGMGLTETGLALGFEPAKAKRRANIAIHYGRELSAANLVDPFIELTSAPTAASRWRTPERLRVVNKSDCDVEAAAQSAAV